MGVDVTIPVVIFQIPVGAHPYPPGTRVACDERPWWGLGVAFVDRGGVFAIRWADGMVSRGTHATKLVLHSVAA